jgi:glycerol kinase
MAVVLTIDSGTTGTRTLAVDESGAVVASSYRELPQHFPRPGWVEHDPAQIWEAAAATVAEVVAAVDAPVAALGITNQRETAVAWDRRDGRTRGPALVWQDRRTAPRCDELREAGALATVRAATGLVLDPYFSATKFEWMLGPGGVEADAALALGTVDSWLLWNLTGGPSGGVHATDASNASRTLLFDITERAWSEELCALFGVPASALPEVVASCGRLGRVAAGVAGGLPAGTPVSGIAGDQQAALFGQACFEPGMTKNTYGTGSFVLMNVGPVPPPPAEGLLTTVAWDLGGRGPFTYALEGSIFVTGAAIQWLRDGLSVISEAAEAEPLARTVEDTGGLYLVPAFAGLGSPHFDPYARGAVVGITRGVGRAHLVRAAIESMAFQTRDVVEAMVAASGRPLGELRVDGGAAVMDLLLQMQADQLGVTVSRPKATETTALGAAFLAGLAEGVWSDTAEVSALWELDARFSPAAHRAGADARWAGWRRALERARRWAVD